MSNTRPGTELSPPIRSTELYGREADGSGWRGYRKKQYSVLLIDDDIQQLALFRYYLEDAGYHVLGASSAAEAFALLARSRVDCIVCDLLMPFIDGCEFSKTIRQDHRLAEIPVIILTAGKPEYETEAISSGADLFCHKREASELLVPQIELLLS